MRNLPILLVLVLLFAGCNDNNEINSSKFSVYLTDYPAEYREVLIDVQQLLINVADDDSGWTELPMAVTGQIDLLQLTNGNDTLLSSQFLPAGKITQMRMVLGDDNMINVDGEYHDLATPSAQQSGLKFKIDATLEEGVDYDMWIDFDAARSVVKRGNGTYLLKPTIRVFTEATSGSITGGIDPPEAKPWVMAVSADNDTTGTFADELTGEFVIRGLDPGNYTVKVKPASGYKEVEKWNVGVTLGQATDIGILILEEL